jgi:hypothetical protein
MGDVALAWIGFGAVAYVIHTILAFWMAAKQRQDPVRAALIWPTRRVVSAPVPMPEMDVPISLILATVELIFTTWLFVSINIWLEQRLDGFAFTAATVASIVVVAWPVWLLSSLVGGLVMIVLRILMSMGGIQKGTVDRPTARGAAPGAIASGISKPKNENTTKPFHANKTPSERKEWFAGTEPWRQVSGVLLDELSAKLEQNPTMFEVFVIASMKAGLVAQYGQIDAVAAKGFTCTLVSGILCKAGMASAQAHIRFLECLQAHMPTDTTKDEAVGHGIFARDALEVAVILDANVLPAYMGLAVLLGNIGDLEPAMRYARDGIAAAKRMQKAPFHLSSIESVRNGAQEANQIEQSLVQIASALEQKLASS